MVRKPRQDYSSNVADGKSSLVFAQSTYIKSKWSLWQMCIADILFTPQTNNTSKSAVEWYGLSAFPLPESWIILLMEFNRISYCSYIEWFIPYQSLWKSASKLCIYQTVLKPITDRGIVSLKMQRIITQKPKEK